MSTCGAPRKWSGKATSSVYSAGRHSETRKAPVPMGAVRKPSTPTVSWYAFGTIGTSQALRRNDALTESMLTRAV